MYKLVHGYCDKEAAPFLKLLIEVAPRGAFRGHSLNSICKEPLNKSNRNLYVLRKVTAWNNLPESVVKELSFESFKNGLDKYWDNQDMLYDYIAQLNTFITRQEST